MGSYPQVPVEESYKQNGCYIFFVDPGQRSLHIKVNLKNIHLYIKINKHARDK